MPSALPRLRVNAGRTGLETESGQPFFWLGDTAWNLLYRFTDFEVTFYLETRRAQGFNVLQIMLMSEQDTRSGTLEGLTPFLEEDVTRPNEAFWARAERLLDQATALGFHLALLPTWGEFVANSPQEFPSHPMFTPETALGYGRWLGSRFSSRQNVVWVLGGDRPVHHAGGDDLPIHRALSAGLRERMPDALQTYHPRGDGTGEGVLPLRNEPWMDFIMYQSGHGAHDTPIWDWFDRDRACRKPLLDGEPCYEDHGVNPWTPDFPSRAVFFRAADVRKQIYRGLLAGGCGVTYGHHAVWQGHDPARYGQPISFADRDWRDGLNRPAAWQMRHARALMERFPDRVPDQGLLRHNPAGGPLHARAARSGDGQAALVYAPPGTAALELNLAGFTAARCAFTWWNPREGSEAASGLVEATEARLTTPEPAEDWVLILRR